VDLVRENWNGLLISPRDVSSLAVAMENLASHPALCLTMGQNSARHISKFSPSEWALGVARALESVGGPHA
jgi:glycosyltransferase involved in cell wall biosynthesis